MEVNSYDNLKFNNSNNSSYNFFKVLDIPGIGYFKSRLIDNISNSKVIIVFIDSSDKKSVVEASEYLYDIINSEEYDDESNLVIACNKSDLKFAKGKSVIEVELNNEVDAKKLIKQKTNLEDQSNELGKLFVSYIFVF